MGGAEKEEGRGRGRLLIYQTKECSNCTREDVSKKYLDFAQVFFFLFFGLARVCSYSSFVGNGKGTGGSSSPRRPFRFRKKIKPVIFCPSSILLTRVSGVLPETF
jgi:hypothetical protein